jgi:hypothetical protein
MLGHAVFVLAMIVVIVLARSPRSSPTVSGRREGELSPTPEFRAAIRARRAVIDAQREELLRW